MNNSVSNAAQAQTNLESMRLCLSLPEIIEAITSFLSFNDLKSVRLLNHLWCSLSMEVWKKKSKIRFSNFWQLRKLLVVASNVRKVLPYSVINWSFKGETVKYLMSQNGHAEQVLFQPFWSSIYNLTFSDWNRLCRIVVLDPAAEPNTPGRLQLVPYYTTTRTGSTYHVAEMLKLCVNLTKLFVDYPLLSKIKGAYLGPKRFPKLEKLILFKIYTNGKKWDDNLSEDATELLLQNLNAADRSVSLPIPRGEPNGGTVLVQRILEHSPNLTYVSFTTGTLLSSKLEAWFMETLLNVTSKLPRLTDFQCSIPLQSIICICLQAKPWHLRSLHLRVVPGIAADQLESDEISNMLISFRNTLQHLELILLTNPVAVGMHECLSKSASQLCQLKTLELWGYNTGSLAFLKNFRALRSAIIGVTAMDGSYELLELFGQNPVPNLKLQLKGPGDLPSRLNQGALSPFQIPI